VIGRISRCDDKEGKRKDFGALRHDSLPEGRRRGWTNSIKKEHFPSTGPISLRKKPAAGDVNGKGEGRGGDFNLRRLSQT